MVAICCPSIEHSLLSKKEGGKFSHKRRGGIEVGVDRGHYDALACTGEEKEPLRKERTGRVFNETIEEEKPVLKNSNIQGRKSPAWGKKVWDPARERRFCRGQKERSSSS